MKKTLVALVVAGVVAPVAQADNVVIYGRLNTAGQYSKIQNGTKDFNLVNQASRFGLKGEEKIGDLTAEFQIENAFDSGSGGGALATRDTFVGVKGGFGGVRVGVIETPSYKLFDATIAKFHNIGLQSYDVTTTANGLSGLSLTGSRIGESVQYRSPEFAGFNFAVQASDGNATVSRFVDGSLVYGGGNNPITAGVAFRTNEHMATGGRDSIYLATAKYRHNAFDVSVGYEFDDFETTSLDQRTAVVRTDTEVHKAFVSGQYNLGNAALVATVGYAGEREVGGVDLANSDAFQYTLGAQYDLSARTQVYGYYTKLDNKAGGTYAVITNPGAGSSGIDNQGAVIGVRHNF